MIRVTIKDTEQIISFLSDQDTLHCLVAGCSANPANLGELLIASEIYRKGIAAEVIADLIEFDKALRQKGPNFIHEAISAAKDQETPLEMTFQAIDDVTEQEATQPRAGELVIFDLPAGVIRASTDLEISASGEIQVKAVGGSAKPTVTYILPKNWGIQSL